MRQITKAEAMSQAHEAREQLGRYQRALQDILNSAVVAVATTQRDEQGGRYTLQLLRPTAPDGGLVIVTFHQTGQTDYSAIHLADELLSTRNIAREPAIMWPALEKMVVARQQALDAEAASRATAGR